MCREVIVAQYLTSTCLIEDGDLYSITEGRLAIDEDGIDIADEGLFADGIVGDVVIDVLDAAVVADLDIVQVGIVEPRVLGDATREVKRLLEKPQAHPAREVGIKYVARDEAILDPDLAPVVCRISVLLKDVDLFSRQRAIFFINQGFHSSIFIKLSHKSTHFLLLIEITPAQYETPPSPKASLPTHTSATPPPPCSPPPHHIEGHPLAGRKAHVPSVESYLSSRWKVRFPQMEQLCRPLVSCDVGKAQTATAPKSRSSSGRLPLGGSEEQDEDVTS